MGKREKSPLGGVKAITEMLVHMALREQDKLLENVAKRDPALVERIRAEMFRFDDFVHLSPRQMQLLVREIQPDRLALALRGVPEELQAHFFSSMSKRAAEALREDLEALGPQKASLVATAQGEVMQVAKKLEGEGKILLHRTKTGEEEVP